MREIKIQFDTDEAALLFASWLCNAGEQDYFAAMEYAENPENVVANFMYHGDQKARREPRYGKFMCDWTIRTKMNREACRE